MMIIRTLFDVDDNEPRTYNRNELSNSEQRMLEIVNCDRVHVSSTTVDNHTSLTYSIL